MTTTDSPPRRAVHAVLAALLIATLACGDGSAAAREDAGTRAAEPVPEGLAVATFAGGCFWCMEPPFDEVEGVKSTTSGYTGGEEAHPSYEEVSYGRTGHAEAVRIVYDPEQVSYDELLHVFWRNVDPTTPDRQFCDAGHQYRTAIYFHDATQEELARRTLSEVRERFEAEVVTEIEPAGPFWVAEEYHQDFYEKNPLRYKTYRKGCGRDARLRELWGEEAGGGH